jgi:hypothetical protein
MLIPQTHFPPSPSRPTRCMSCGQVYVAGKKSHIVHGYFRKSLGKNGMCGLLGCVAAIWCRSMTLLLHESSESAIRSVNDGHLGERADFLSGNGTKDVGYDNRSDGRSAMRSIMRRTSPRSRPGWYLVSGVGVYWHCIHTLVCSKRHVEFNPSSGCIVTVDVRVGDTCGWQRS